MRNNRAVVLALAVVLFAPAATEAADAPALHPRRGCVIRERGAATRTTAPNAGRPLAAEPLLSFTFDSPTSPWGAEELAELQVQLRLLLPAITARCGPPFQSDLVNVAKDPTLLDDGIAGTYSPARKEITLYGVDPGVLCHELAHAFHGDAVAFHDQIEEGMARDVEVAVMSQLPEYPYWNVHQSAIDAVNYEILNQPSIGPARGSFFSGLPNPNLRYTLAGYVWTKVELEHPGFMRAFDQAYYDLVRTNPAVSDSLIRLLDLAGQLAPTVEGRPFGVWARAQHVLGTAPVLGLQLYQFLPAGGIGVFRRYANGREELLSGIPVRWKVVDADGLVVDEGRSTSDPYGFVYPVSSLPGGSRGRLQIEAEVQDQAEIYRSVGLRPVVSGSGLFGLVEGADEGWITIWGDERAAVRVPVLFGQFEAAEIQSRTGRFELHFSDRFGREASRLVTKDAARYLAMISVSVPVAPASARLIARPSVALTGCRFTLDRVPEHPATVAVYSIAGRRLRTLPLAGGSRSVDWDGKDDSGLPVASGVLVARLVSPGIETSTRFVALR